MQGIYMKGHRRPKSKKEVKEAIAAGEGIVLEATSVFGNEYGGQVKDAPDGQYNFVGPDPHTNRRFYGTITKNGDKITVK
jgi:hypothetical protein